MQPLRTCDFCGADALGTFDVVPPELEPTPAERRRISLCRSCKQHLEVVLEPLLARASAPEPDAASDSGGEAGSTASRRQTHGADDSSRRDPPTLETADPEANAEDGESDSVVASADGSTEKRRPDRRPNASVTEPDEMDELTRANDAEPREESKGVTFEKEVTDRQLEDDDRSTAPGSEPVAEEEADATASEPVQSAESAQPGEPDLERRTVAKVTRLLQHRELPIERAAAEELAAGAYDLEDEEVAAIVDWTIERGEFRERDGRLHRA